MTREETLDTAKRIVTGKREQEYGKVEDSFSIIAGLWSAYLDRKISPVDVSMMMALLKIARVRGGGSEDCFIDLAGYAACGGELWGRKGRCDLRIATNITPEKTEGYMSIPVNGKTETGQDIRCRYNYSTGEWVDSTGEKVKLKWWRPID